MSSKKIILKDISLLEIDYGSDPTEHINITILKNIHFLRFLYALNQLFIHMRLSKYKMLVLEISFGTLLPWTIRFHSGIKRRTDHEIATIFEINFLFFDVKLCIEDFRHYNNHEDQFETEEEAKLLCEGVYNPPGKPKFKWRPEKYKEYFVSKLVKIYNTNFLNNPYGIMLEFTLPFLYYLKISLGRTNYSWLGMDLRLEFLTPKLGLIKTFSSICILGYKISLEFAKNQCAECKIGIQD